MTEKELLKLKEVYFRESIRRTGIPAKYYELPPEVIAKYEDHKKLDKERIDEYVKEKAEQEQEFPGRVVKRLSRRPVGYYFPGEYNE